MSASDASTNTVYLDYSGKLFLRGGLIVNKSNSTANDILFNGVPSAGTKAYFQYDASKGALHSGVTTGSEWSDANSGPYSLSLGTNNIASGVNSVSMGSGNSASNAESIAVGNGNTSSGITSFVAGLQNTCSATAGVALGRSNTVSAGGINAVCAGESNTCTQRASVALGRSNTSSGLSGSVALGFFNSAIGDSGSVAMGYRTNATAVSSIAIGSSYSAASYCTAQDANTVEICTNSDTPSLKVFRSLGAGTTASVGFSTDTTTLSQKLIVDGSSYLGGETSITGNLLFPVAGAGLVSGSMAVEGNATATVISVQNTWYQFTNFASSTSNETSPSYASSGIILSHTGLYSVAASISFSGGASKTYELEIRRNNGANRERMLHADRMLNASGDIGSVSISGHAWFSAGSIVELWLRCTDAATSNATLRDVNLSLIMIGR